MKPLSLIFVIATGLVFAQVKSPDDRPITDPKSLTSRSSTKAGPIAIDELFYTRAVTSPAWSPDGKEIVFSTNLSGRLNLWKVAADGGWPLQLSQSDDRESGAAWSPDAKWIVYEQDYGGGEYYDLFAIPANGGAPVNLTNTKDVSESDALWSHDGTSIAFAQKLKTSATTNIALMNWQSRTTKSLTSEKTSDQSWRAATWSRDGQFILAERMNADRTDASVYRIETATGKAEELTPHTGQIAYTVSSVSPDGKTALVGSNEKRGFTNVALLDIATKKLTWVTDLQWEAEPGEFSPKGDRFTYQVNEDGRTDLYLVERASLRSTKVAFPPGSSFFAGNPTPWSPSGDRLIVSHQDSQRPSDLWIYDAGKGRRGN